MQTTDFLSPLEGKIVSIEKVPDEAFSSRVMGDGFAVIVSGNDVVAPISGTVTAIYPTGHAVCIEGDSGSPGSGNFQRFWIDKQRRLVVKEEDVFNGMYRSKVLLNVPATTEFPAPPPKDAQPAPKSG